MPISAGDFRKGVVFEMDGKPMLVVDFQHVKPGKSTATMTVICTTSWILRPMT